MNRREFLATGAAACGAGALGRLWPRHAPPAHPLALDTEALALLREQARPGQTLIGCGCPSPSRTDLFPALWPRLLAFDTITPCNALKWRDYNANPADAHAIANYCREYRKRLRLHTPLWGVPQGATPRDKAVGYVEELAREFGDIAYAWDIVNEPIHFAQPATLVAEMVAAARELTPGAAIAVNEWDVIHSPQGQSDRCCLGALVDYARAVGADTIGVQAHGHRWYTREEVERTLYEIEAAGLQAHITENIFRSDGSPVIIGNRREWERATLGLAPFGTWTETAQALAYRDMLAIVRAHPAATSITFWTLTDAAVWPVMPRGGLTDARLRAKPAWRQLFEKT